MVIEHTRLQRTFYISIIVTVFHANVILKMDSFHCRMNATTVSIYNDSMDFLLFPWTMLLIQGKGITSYKITLNGKICGQRRGKSWDFARAPGFDEDIYIEDGPQKKLNAPFLLQFFQSGVGHSKRELIYPAMVLILDGNSDRGVQVRINLYYLIRLRLRLDLQLEKPNH